MIGFFCHEWTSFYMPRNMSLRRSPRSSPDSLGDPWHKQAEVPAGQLSRLPQEAHRSDRSPHFPPRPGPLCCSRTCRQTASPVPAQTTLNTCLTSPDFSSPCKRRSPSISPGGAEKPPFPRELKDPTLPQNQEAALGAGGGNEVE